MTHVNIGHVVLGGGTTAVIVPIQPARPEDLPDAARAAAGADIIEWRMDALSHLTPEQILDAARDLRNATSCPILATFRTAAEGGPAHIEASAYAALLRALAEGGKVDAIDVEWFSHPSPGPLSRALQASGSVVVGSYHNFASTPPVAELVERMQLMANGGANVAKVAVMPTHALDVLQLLEASHTSSSQLDVPIIAISMGELGAITRIAGAQFGSVATFASVGEGSAPGQFSLESVREILRYL